MATAYPVTFDVPRPEKFERTQVAIRIAVLLVVGILGTFVSDGLASVWGWIPGAIYLVIPVLAAIFISQGGAEKYFPDTRIPTIIRWYLALYCYLVVLTDQFPTQEPEKIIRFQVRPSGSPTVGSALLRLLFSLPSAIILAVLGIGGAVVWVIAVISVLIQENYAESLYNFQLGIMRWQARLLGYHASLADQYPPFALDTGPESEPPSPPAMAAS